MTSTISPPTTPKRAQPKRAAIAAVAGGALEYYDFVLFGTAAALVFPKVFFQDTGGIAYLVSFLSFGVAYIARPLGAVVLSHIGDRYGRKLALLLTISIMGAATFLIGCLPSADTIGMVAPILLVLLRLMQGFSAGAELAGASTLTLEHAPMGRRAFTTSFSLVGVGIGSTLAGLAMIPVAALPEEDMLSWGWRLPFLASILVLVIGIWIRRGIEEPEAFTEINKSEEAKKKVPILQALRFNWQGILRVAAANLYAVVNSVVLVFALAFAVETGIDRAMMVLVATLGQGLAIFVRPLGGLLADKIGRKPVFIFGAIASGLLVFPYFMAIAAGNVPGIFLINLLLLGVACGLADGAYPAFYSEMFTSTMRFTGMAVGLQLGVVVAGFAPSIANALQAGDPAAWLPVAILVIVCSLIAVVAAITAKDEFKTPLNELGITKQMRRYEEKHGKPVL